MEIKQQPSRIHRKGHEPIIIGVDIGRKDSTAICVRQGTKIVLSAGGPSLEIDRDWINGLHASRKDNRTVLAMALKAIASARGAELTVEREEPRNPGYCGAGIDLQFRLNGVGAMLDINDLHGGEWSLIHWFNDREYSGEPGSMVARYPVRNFTTRFQRLSGDGGAGRPHHKSTSFPRDWYSLAMMLDAGLMLAARGEAFEPEKAEGSAT